MSETWEESAEPDPVEEGDQPATTPQEQSAESTESEQSPDGFDLGKTEEESQHTRERSTDDSLEPEDDADPETSEGLGNTLEEDNQDDDPGFEDSGPSLSVLDGDYLVRHWRAFVPPVAWEPLSIDGSHVVLIHGDEYSGKLAAALNFFPHSEERGWFLYTRRDSLPLSVAASHRNWPSNSIVVLEDVFEKGVRQSELAFNDFALLQRSLRSRNSSLLLTATADVEGLTITEVPRFSTAGADPKTVFDSHLAWHRKGGGLEPRVADLAASLWSRVQADLIYPSQIERFCQLLTRDQPSTKEAIQKLAKSPEILRTNLRPWFEALRPEGQYFAILAAIFHGLDRTQFDRLFVESLYALRKEGCDFLGDPRQLDLSVLAEAVQLREGTEVEFEEGSVLKEAMRRAGGRAEILWPVVLRTLERVRNKDHLIWKQRWLVGEALGRVGLHDPLRYRDVLSQLAETRAVQGAGNSVAALSGYALTETFEHQGAAGREFVSSILRTWQESDDPHLLWATAAALWRILIANERALGDFDEEGEKGKFAFRNELRARLKELGKKAEVFEVPNGIRRKILGTIPADQARDYLRRLCDQVRGAAADALARFGIHDPSLMVRITQSWLEPGVEVPRRVLNWGLQNYVKLLTTRPLDAPPFETLLDLMEVLLRSDFPIKSPGLASLATFLLNACQDAEIRQLALARWLDLAHAGPAQTRLRLRLTLSRVDWDCGGTAVRALRQAVLVRCYALDGILLDRPSAGQGLVVVDQLLFEPNDKDPKGREEKVQNRHRACGQLLGILDAHLDLSVVELGAPTPVKLNLESGTAALVGPYRLPRLVVPSVQASKGHKWELVVILGVGPILDLEDLGESALAERTLLVSIGDTAPSVEGIDRIPLPSDLLPESLGALDRRLEEYWACRIVEARRADWEPVLKSFAFNHPNGPTEPVWLEAVARAAAEPSSARGERDLVRLLLVSFFWLAADDLGLALGTLASWLSAEPTPGDLRRSLGIAAAAAFFRAYSVSRRTAVGGLPERLFDALAEPLARTGPDGIDVVLAAVENWLRIPDLADYFAGGVIAGRGRLLRWAERFAPTRIKAFEGAVGRLKRSDPWADPDPTVEEIRDRIRGLLAAGVPKPWPDLAMGERLAVVVLDTADEKRSSPELAPRAVELFDFFSEVGLRPVIIRLGEHRPIWVPGDPSPRAKDLLVKSGHSPRLIGPILEQLDPGRTAVVVLLSREPMLDGEDFMTGPWRALLLALSPAPPPGWQGLVTSLPRLRQQESAASYRPYLTDRLCIPSSQHEGERT